uniref:site-specific tyrosine recombinase/integron integrase n=1 Tax=Lutibacter citreus TaxID=2138210 RepID=UPI00293726F4
LKRDVVKNIDSIQMYFKYNDELLNIIRGLKGFKWSSSIRCWHGEFNQNNLNLIRQTFKDIVILIDDNSLYTAPTIKRIKVNRKLSEENSVVMDSFIKYLEGRRYSRSTIETYAIFIGDFLEYLKKKSITNTTNRDVELFIEDVFIPKGYSISTHRQFVSAIKLFKVFYPESGIEELNLTMPRKDRHLPVVLSQQEVLEILRCTKNLKHRAILALLYSCGLRVGELINLELKHIDINRNQIAVKNSKGRKDRYVKMADSLAPLIKNYVQTFKPVVYFAEGKPNGKYTASSVRAFLKRSCQLAQINKRVTPHTLRHSYATHLLEGGTDIRLIQTLLGHNKPETTMIYTHVSTSSLDRISNPLDEAVKKFMVNGNNEDYLKIGSK